MNNYTLSYRPNFFSFVVVVQLIMNQRKEKEAKFVIKLPADFHYKIRTLDIISQPKTTNKKRRFNWKIPHSIKIFWSFGQVKNGANN